MSDLTDDDVRRLRQAVEAESHTMELLEGDAHTRGGEESLEGMHQANQQRTSEIVAELAERGVTEEDLEAFLAREANPRFQEPAGLGHVIVDECDFDHEISE